MTSQMCRSSWKNFREGNDIVMGNRFSGGIKPGAMPPLHKYFGNPGLTAILNTLFHARIGDGLLRNAWIHAQFVRPAWTCAVRGWNSRWR